MARPGNVSESKAVAEIGEQWRVKQCVHFSFFVTKMNCDLASVSSWRHLIRQVRSHFVSQQFNDVATSTLCAFALTQNNCNTGVVTRRKWGWGVGD